MNKPQQQNQNKKGSFLKLLQSILAGAIGVQSNKKYQEDFQSNSILPFVIGGIIFTGLFIGSILLLVNYLIASHA